MLVYVGICWYMLVYVGCEDKLYILKQQCYATLTTLSTLSRPADLVAMRVI